LALLLKKLPPIIPNIALIIILCSFLSASNAIFFIPLHKPDDESEPLAARRLWLYTLIPTQWTVILAVLGITNAVVSRVFG
jgi:hypothetical protein